MSQRDHNYDIQTTITRKPKCVPNQVRHEAAEALGAIGSPDAISVLREFTEHPEPILRESCWVALHMYDREAFLAAGVCV